MSEELMRWKPQPATVIALIALFVAIGGTAFAAGLAKNSVKSKHIKDGQVKTADIADSGVGTIDLADGSVSTAKIGANAVDTSKILDATVGTADLANDSVDSDKVAANSLGAADLAPDSVGSSEIAANVVNADELADAHLHTGNLVNVTDAIAINADWTQGANSTATCAAAETLLSGYLEWTTNGDELAARELILNPGAGTVVANGINDDGSLQTYRAVAVCI